MSQCFRPSVQALRVKSIIIITIVIIVTITIVTIITIIVVIITKVKCVGFLASAGLGSHRVGLRVWVREFMGMSL